MSPEQLCADVCYPELDDTCIPCISKFCETEESKSETLPEQFADFRVRVILERRATDAERNSPYQGTWISLATATSAPIDTLTRAQIVYSRVTEML